MTTDQVSTFLAAEFAVNEQSASWVQLSPFGDFDNSAGMQRVRTDDAQAVVNDFKSLVRLPRRAMGLPWYIGHPDHPSFEAKYRDTKAYGRVKDLEVRHDVACAACEQFVSRRTPDVEPCRVHGLFANVRWSEDGKRLIANEAFHGHSVHWRLRREGAVWRPVSLKSVGFTNEPGIPVAPVTAANESNDKMLALLRTLMGKATATEEEATAFLNERVSELTALKTDLTTVKAQLALREEDIVALANEVKHYQDETPKLEAEAKRVPDLLKQITEQETALANERKERVALLVGQALLDGRITKADEERWTKDLTADFATANEKFSKLTPAIKTRSEVNVAGQNAQVQDAQTASNQFLEEVNKVIANEHLSYSDAWAKCKQTQKALFDRMSAK